MRRDLSPTLFRCLARVHFIKHYYETPRQEKKIEHWLRETYIYMSVITNNFITLVNIVLRKCLREALALLVRCKISCFADYVLSVERRMSFDL